MTQHILEFNKEDRVAIPLDLFLGGSTFETNPSEATEADLLNYDGIKIEKSKQGCRLVFDSWDKMQEILTNISKRN